MLEMESLATEEVSPDDDREGVSNSELAEDCVPDLERDAGIGREKTGSVMTKKSVSRLYEETKPFYSQEVSIPSAHRQCSSKLSRENKPCRADIIRSSPRPLGDCSTF